MVRWITVVCLFQECHSHGMYEYFFLWLHCGHSCGNSCHLVSFQLKKWTCTCHAKQWPTPPSPKASREWLSVLNWVVSQRRPLHILIEVTSKCGWIDLSKEPYVRSQCGRMRQNFLPCMILATDNLLLSGPKSDQSCGWTVHGHDFALSGTWSASQIF